MILIDTNVVSELSKAVPDPRVTRWLLAHFDQTLLSTLVIAEIAAGIGTTRGADKRDALSNWFRRIVARHEGRIMPFDEKAAWAWGDMASRMLLGDLRARHMDSLLAAQGLALGVAVATRNVRHFEDTGVMVVNPWES